MIEWEYKTVRIYGWPGSADLNGHGREGWELVQVLDGDPAAIPGSDRRLMVFKRRRPS